MKTEISNGGLNELALFAGAGGGILAGHLLGWRTVCAVELDAYCAALLAQRQNDEALPVFPIWSDVQTFDGRPWRGLVEVVSGGFPCQDIAACGKRAGIHGKKSGLWFEMLRIIREVAPAYLFIENSQNLRTAGLCEILEGLTALGFNDEWDCIGAQAAGAPHLERMRLWQRASNSDRLSEEQQRGCQKGSSETKFAKSSSNNPRESNTESHRREPGREECEQQTWGSNSWWSAEPDVDRMVHGLPFRMDRIRALGNAQIPAVAKLAWERLQ
jgi:DNA (cytosine-5)-methyltransferase 1